MTKYDLIAKLADRNPQLAATDAKAVVTAILDAMTTTLIKGQRIEIRGFGVFRITYRPARIGHNPKTAQKVQVPAKFLPHFKAGKELRERVDSN